MRNEAGAVVFQWCCSGAAVVLLWSPQTEGQTQGFILQVVEGMMERNASVGCRSVQKCSHGLQRLPAAGPQPPSAGVCLLRAARWTHDQRCFRGMSSCPKPSLHWRLFLVNVSVLWAQKHTWVACTGFTGTQSFHSLTCRPAALFQKKRSKHKKK